MRDLGWMEEWLDATARAARPEVRLSSCFPYVRKTLLIQPPRTVWPPAQTGKLRWKSARFVPASLVPSLLRAEELNPDQWIVDPVSGCLLPVEKNAPPSPPFRVAQQASAPVDRVTGVSEDPHSTAFIQFAPGCGVWFLAVVDDGAFDVWRDRIKAAARLLADTGLGGERSKGWGRSEPPVFDQGEFPRVLLDEPGQNGGEKAWWLISLFSPSESDAVDWSRGSYEVMTRTGRLESAARWGDLKPATRMVGEGSVVLSQEAPVGAARNVAPNGVPHPVYRSGLALALPVSWYESRRLSWLAAERPQPSPPVPAVDTAETPGVAVEPEERPEPPVGEPEPDQPEPPPSEPPMPSEPAVEEPPAEQPEVEEPGKEPPPVKAEETIGVPGDAEPPLVAGAEETGAQEVVPVEPETPVQETPSAPDITPSIAEDAEPPLIAGAEETGVQELVPTTETPASAPEDAPSPPESEEKQS
jgi:CRISPR type III-A-associated RAMP protein Csm4